MHKIDIKASWYKDIENAYGSDKALEALYNNIGTNCRFVAIRKHFFVSAQERVTAKLPTVSLGFMDEAGNIERSSIPLLGKGPDEGQAKRSLLFAALNPRTQVAAFGNSLDRVGLVVGRNTFVTVAP